MWWPNDALNSFKTTAGQEVDFMEVKAAYDAQNARLTAMNTAIAATNVVTTAWNAQAVLLTAQRADAMKAGFETPV